VRPYVASGLAGSAELLRFASGLRLAEAAVAAALTEHWSKEPVEGSSS